jgi:site-specific recombinase XerC
MNDSMSTALDVITAGQTDNPADIFLATQQSKTGRSAQRSSLRVIAEIAGFADYHDVPWHELRYEHVLAIRSKLIETRNYKTVNKMMVALRGVLKECWRAGKITAEELAKIQSVGTIRGESQPAGKARSEEEIGRLVNTCEDDLIGIRDRALLAVMYVCGLRRAEVVALDAENYNSSSGALSVIGKGNRERIVYVADEGAIKLLEAWLNVRRKAAEEDELHEKTFGTRRGIYSDTGPLFYKTNGHHELYPARMAATTLHFMIERRGRMAGLPDLTCHDLRRSYATNLLDAGADVLTVSKLMGHKSLDTTRVYDRRPEAAKKAASGLVHIRQNPRETK